jgi:hypothetical protein
LLTVWRAGIAIVVTQHLSTRLPAQKLSATRATRARLRRLLLLRRRSVAKRRAPIKKAKAKPFPDDWEISEELVVVGKRYTLVPGRAFKVHGSNTKFRFKRYVRRSEAGVEWITGWGGRSGCEQWCSFKPSQIKWIGKNIETNALKDR